MEPSGSQHFLASSRTKPADRKATSLDSHPIQHHQQQQRRRKTTHERRSKSQIDPEPNDPRSHTFLPVGHATSGIEWAPTIVRVDYDNNEPDATILNADSIILPRDDDHPEDEIDWGASNKKSNSPKSSSSLSRSKISSSSYRTASYSDHHHEKQRRDMVNMKASSQPHLSLSSSSASSKKTDELLPTYKDQVRAAGIQFKDQARAAVPFYKDQVQPVDFGRPANHHPENSQATRATPTTVKATSLLVSSSAQQQPLKKMNKEPSNALKAKSFSGRKAEPEYEKSRDSRTILMPPHYHSPTTKVDISQWSPSSSSSTKKDMGIAVDDHVPSFKSHRMSNKGIPIGNAMAATGLAVPETTTSTMDEPHVSSSVTDNSYNMGSTVVVATSPRAVPDSTSHTMVEKKSTAPPATRPKQQHLPSINEGNAYVSEVHENKTSNPQCPFPPKAFIWVAIILQVLLIVVIAPVATNHLQDCNDNRGDHSTNMSRALQVKNDVRRIEEIPTALMPTPEPYVQPSRFPGLETPTQSPSDATPKPGQVSATAPPSNVTFNSTQNPGSNTGITDKLDDKSPSSTPFPSSTPSVRPSTMIPTVQTSKIPSSISESEVPSCSTGFWVGIALLSEALLCGGLYLYYHYWKSSLPKSNDIVSTQDAPSSICREPTDVEPGPQVRYVEESMIQWDHNLNPIIDEENGNDEEEDLYPFSVVSVAHPR